MPKPKLVNQNRSVGQTLRSEGMTMEEIAEQAFMWGVVPACCKHHCQVGPDGRCIHGKPSILIASGIL